ncbi:hypothetical protein BS47DRAFT_1345984 [Hydnum rufescens UP504]|uniref:Uncharacterized protein n=1 Tax=Hydnum rufescens UP504 TaxID=1448309 RepID=A0A9P6AUN7_9AGAM|nr:hypothetical protein BS47DRAFT_1345984 [Hydnum rufescens UP504]
MCASLSWSLRRVTCACTQFHIRDKCCCKFRISGCASPATSDTFSDIGRNSDYCPSSTSDLSTCLFAVLIRAPRDSRISAQQQYRL